MDVGAGDPGYGVFGDRRWENENEVKCGLISALETPANAALFFCVRQVMGPWVINK